MLKSDKCEKPLDQSTIPLIAPSQLQPCLYQNIQNLDVLLIGSLVILNVSNALIGLQSQQAHNRDAGGLKVTKIKLKQSTQISRKVLLFGREMEISDACMNIKFRPRYSRGHWNIQWCGGTECGTKRRHCKLYSKNRSGGCCSSYCLVCAACKKCVGRQYMTFALCQNAACSN